MDEFQAFLADWLVRAGWSINRLADETGISQSLISRWLHSDLHKRVRPTDASLSRLAPVVGIEQHELMRMAGRLDAPASPRPPLSVQQRNIDQEYDRWMDIMTPRMGQAAAHNAFWDPFVAEAKTRRETLERALYSPDTNAVYPPDNTDHPRINRVGKTKKADNRTLFTWLKGPSLVFATAA